MTLAELEPVPAIDIPPLDSDRLRAREPDAGGHVERDGVRIWWEAYGDPAAPAVFLLPPWGLVHSRAWRQQVPVLADHLRVLVADAPGSGRSGPSGDARRHGPAAVAADCLAVLDAARVQRAVLVGHSRGAQWLLHLAAEHPERVNGAVFLAPFLPVTPSLFPYALTHPLLRRLGQVPMPMHPGWARMSPPAWRRDFEGFVRWFARRAISTPHSEVGVAETVEYALDADRPSLVASQAAPMLRGGRAIGALADRLRCPALVLHGESDRIVPEADSRWLARRLGAELVVVPGADHCPHSRHPLPVNDHLLEFCGVRAEETGPPPSRTGRTAKRRVLFLSSPIGLGHARRDLAIARELRALTADVEVTWLTQHPTTAFLEAAGERVHPASRRLASEVAVLETEADGHTLRAFRAFRRADEILTANFHVFRDVVRAEDYDLWVGDEAWEVDRFLHDFPAEKRAPFVWMTDYVGLLPGSLDDERERALIADVNALGLQQRDRTPHVRDRSIFVGEPGDCVDRPFGPGMPSIREWTARHFDFAGYVQGPGAPAADRARLGWGDEPVCVVAVGGSGVGATLLRRTIGAAEALRERVPGLRVVAVAGPRIDPATLPAAAGVEVHGYVHDLHRVLAAADVAVVQGGLASTMELAAARVPFVFVPLTGHFEQEVHVSHRLVRYGAGVRLDADDCTPAGLAEHVALALGRDAVPQPVEAGGAGRVAAMLAEVLDGR